MSARFYFSSDLMFLQPDYIPTLAATAFKEVFDLASLQKHVDKQGTLVLPEDQFLVLAGNTDDLKKLRTQLNAAKITAIGSGERRLSHAASSLVARCARVDVTHPDHKWKPHTTVTLVVICRPSLWGGPAPVAKPPWYDFPSVFGAVSLDDIFDSALDLAKKHPKAN